MKLDILIYVSTASEEPLKLCSVSINLILNNKTNHILQTKYLYNAATTQCSLLVLRSRHIGVTVITRFQFMNNVHAETGKLTSLKVPMFPIGAS